MKAAVFNAMITLLLCTTLVLLTGCPEPADPIWEPAPGFTPAPGLPDLQPITPAPVGDGTSDAGSPDGSAGGGPGADPGGTGAGDPGGQPGTTPQTSAFTHYTVYRALANKADMDADFGCGAMSGDGQTVAFVSYTPFDAPWYEQDKWINLLSADGTGLQSYALPATGGLADMVMSRDGSRVFCRSTTGADHAIYKLENGTVTTIDTRFNDQDYTPGEGIFTTADGEWVYLMPYGVEEVWRVRHDGSQPECLFTNEDVPIGQGCHAWSIYNIAVSADGNSIALITEGYVDSLGAVTQNHFEVVLWQRGSFTRLTRDEPETYKYKARISGDGSTVVYGLFGEGWCSIKSDGSAHTHLYGLGAGGDALDVALSYDGSKAFVASGGNFIANTDGSGLVNLGTGCFRTSIFYGISISDDASRIYCDYEGTLYTGYLSEPDAVPDAPSVDWIAFNPAVMPREPDATLTITAAISGLDGPDDLRALVTEALIGGMVDGVYAAPWPRYGVRDNGTYGDEVAGDGIYSDIICQGNEFNELDVGTIRIGVMDSDGNVTVAHTDLRIGS